MLALFGCRPVQGECAVEIVDHIAKVAHILVRQRYVDARICRCLGAVAHAVLVVGIHDVGVHAHGHCLVVETDFVARSHSVESVDKHIVAVNLNLADAFQWSAVEGGGRGVEFHVGLEFAQRIRCYDKVRRSRWRRRQGACHYLHVVNIESTHVGVADAVESDTEQAVGRSHEFAVHFLPGIAVVGDG